MRKLSIVVPVYNVERYLTRCMESLYMQDLDTTEFEVIVVNDETPDNSLAIAEKFAEKYQNIRIVNRPNGGLAAARNTGIDVAQGKYLWFIDSDDRIEPDCMGKLVKKAEEDDLDILCFNLKLEFPDGHKRDCSINDRSESKVCSGRDYISQVNMPPSACIALFRRDFLYNNKLRFMEGILHEDQEFTPRAYCLANRIAFHNWPIYYYYQRSGSIMKSDQNCKRCKDLLTIADSLYSFVRTHFPNDSKIKDIFFYKINFLVTQSLAFYNKKYMSFSEYRNKPYYPLVITYGSSSFKWKCRLINFSVPLYLFLHKHIPR